jgi:hypothetical protein
LDRIFSNDFKGENIMATTLSTIREKVRNVLGDYSISQKDLFTYEASSVFTLTQNNPISVSTVYKNSVELSASDWSFNSDTNKVTISASLSTGDTVEIDYICYLNYSNNELKNAIKSAIIYLSINNYYDFEYDDDTDTIYPELEEREENLISIITAILVEQPIQTLRLPDLTINLPSDLNQADKIAKTIAGYKKNSHGIITIL